jgi:hypothetical protein
MFSFAMQSSKVWRPDCRGISKQRGSPVIPSQATSNGEAKFA